jgi:hypothetical protein
MTKDLKWFKFGGACVAVAEGELQASLNDCSQNEHEHFIDSLFAEYVQAGEPKEVKAWLRNALNKRFLSVGARPEWVQGQPSWPWLKGKPMVFLEQFAVPSNDVTKAHVSENTVIYVFGARVTTSNGWKMEYRIVEQHADLKGVVALVESEMPPHTTANTKLVKHKTTGRES